jgi:hypothetical protein
MFKERKRHRNNKDKVAYLCMIDISETKDVVIAFMTTRRRVVPFMEILKFGGLHISKRGMITFVATARHTEDK